MDTPRALFEKRPIIRHSLWNLVSSRFHPPPVDYLRKMGFVEKKPLPRCTLDMFFSISTHAFDSAHQVADQLVRFVPASSLENEGMYTCGARQDFLQVYETMYRDFGRFSWNDWRGSSVWENELQHPPPTVTGSHWDPPPIVTESHFRLSHLHHDVSLVDLVNFADHQITFVRERECFGHEHSRKAKGLTTYILRDRQISCLNRTPSAIPQALHPEIMRGQGLFGL